MTTSGRARLMSLRDQGVSETEIRFVSTDGVCGEGDGGGGEGGTEGGERGECVVVVTDVRV